MTVDPTNYAFEDRNGSLVPIHQPTFQKAVDKHVAVKSAPQNTVHAEVLIFPVMCIANAKTICQGIFV